MNNSVVDPVKPITSQWLNGRFLLFSSRRLWMMWLQHMIGILVVLPAFLSSTTFFLLKRFTSTSRRFQYFLSVAVAVSSHFLLETKSLELLILFSPFVLFASIVGSSVADSGKIRYLMAAVGVYLLLFFNMRTY